MKKIEGQITLNGSKSISNRVLLIQAIAEQNFPIVGLSKAKDTLILQKLLKEQPLEYQVGDAGTACRFLTAYLATQNQYKKLSGSARMHQRPIGDLVTALRQLGAKIEYLQEEGFPPLAFLGESPNIGRQLAINATISSQFISALLLIAPRLSQGLELTLIGKIVSRSYIQMTLDLMQLLGVDSTWKGNIIAVPKQNYRPKTIAIEADWSAASYYYSLAALSDTAHLKLKGLFANSIQGDAILVKLMEQFGVQTNFEQEGIVLTKTVAKINYFSYDFSSCPDIAQTLMVVCAALDIPCRLTGLETLSIKETNRLTAPKTELEKLGCQIKITANSWQQIKGIQNKNQKISIATYNDHRMAMAFAPLRLWLPYLTIENPEVVAKSYPYFWADMKSLGLDFLF